MSLHHLASICSSHPGSLSCLLYFLCMLAIPIFLLFKFEEFLIYLYNLGTCLLHCDNYCRGWGAGGAAEVSVLGCVQVYERYNVANSRAALATDLLSS